MVRAARADDEPLHQITETVLTDDLQIPGDHGGHHRPSEPYFVVLYREEVVEPLRAGLVEHLEAGARPGPDAAERRARRQLPEIVFLQLLGQPDIGIGLAEPEGEPVGDRDAGDGVVDIDVAGM